MNNTVRISKILGDLKTAKYTVVDLRELDWKKGYKNGEHWRFDKYPEMIVVLSKEIEPYDRMDDSGGGATGFKITCEIKGKVVLQSMSKDVEEFWKSRVDLENKIEENKGLDELDRIIKL